MNEQFPVGFYGNTCFIQKNYGKRINLELGVSVWSQHTYETDDSCKPQLAHLLGTFGIQTKLTYISG